MDAVHEVLGRSALVSLSATAIALLLGVPLGTWLALSRIRGHRDPGDERRGDQDLGDDHAAQRVDQLELPQRAAPPQHERHEQADHHGRDRHPGVHRRGQPSPSADSGEREPGAKRDAEAERDQRGAHGDERRAPQHLMHRVHQRRASGRNNGSP
jgi:hypothetical protein